MASQPSVFSRASYKKIQDDLTRRCIEKDNYIKALEEMLKTHGIELPPSELVVNPPMYEAVDNLMKQGSLEELESIVQKHIDLIRNFDHSIEFHGLNYSTEVPKKKVIPTVGSLLVSLFTFWLPQEMETINILADATGRIAPRKMTLLIGPPGSGKSVLLKALAGRLRSLGGAKMSGEVYYDGDNIKSGKFLVGKVADYVEQGDTHEAVLTVAETILFSWQCTSGGHHGYARARDESTAEILNKDDEGHILPKNVSIALGLNGCKDTLVGNGMIRGVSGGQKRRVTIGEMVACPRPIKLMDSISNGLDTATTFDIIRTIKLFSSKIGTTTVISLLQPPPDVFNQFDEIILLSEGHIIYQGPRTSVMEYFQDLGYVCPAQVDEADFLQELPTPEGRRFIKVVGAPHSPADLAAAWKKSALYQQLLSEMRYPSLEDAEKLEKSNTKVWYADQLERFAGSFWFYFELLLDRQMKIVFRDSSFVKARIGQVLLVGAISGSLFNDIAVTDVSTMNGFLFNTLLFSALGGFAILPIIYAQKAVYYKQKDSLFFPTSAFCLAQTISFFPLQVIEAIMYIVIVYWSADLSHQYRGSRFLTFIVISLIFSMTISQMFRVIAAFIPDMDGALPIAGIIVVIMVLFSGFIQPKALISDGWSWFYWMNPVAWALKAVTINEFSSDKYDFLTCTNPSCTEKSRFGDFVLKQYGNPTDEAYIWYSFAVLVAEYLFLFFVTFVSLRYVRTEPTPPAPIRLPESDSDPASLFASASGDVGDIEAADSNGPGLELAPRAPTRTPSGRVLESSKGSSKRSSNRLVKAQLPYDPISFAFKDIWYTVTLSSGEDVDLLRGVNGYFEPGTVTALMGSSGAGKTTLLDVLAGRKNTGVVKGEMYLNGVPKVEGYFRKIMGYVEQFDSLSVKCTARECVEFSAALRLASDITADQRDAWVNAVLEMMDLEAIQDELIGSAEAGGMSFEQRKRVSIAVELAANPSVLFLDEPTTGLDSRAAQNVVRNIRTIAASGRTVVCTIHQPSTAIFESFDHLLLLRKGGQTVFFGHLGKESRNLVEFFEMAPDVTPLPPKTNPATWMLDVIGAGTATAAHSQQSVDFHAHYKQSSLAELNMDHLQKLMTPNEGSKRVMEEEEAASKKRSVYSMYNTSYLQQFWMIFKRFALTYWRTPSYALVRHFTMIFIALIFASAYPRQDYHTYVATMSRAAVIYITAFFCGILAMITVTPVFLEERPVFYREQQSRMYSVFVYLLTLVVLEIPYLIVSSLSFTLPFFYIVGFDNVGNKIQKFFWFWFFNFLVQAVFMCFGILFVALAPNEATTHVLGGLTNTLMGLFCGFLISEQNYPPFWTFMYWLNPLHYGLEGLFMTMFHGDTTMIRLMDNSKTTAEDYIVNYAFTTWSYGQVGIDVLALGLFCFGTLAATYLCLSYLRHDKR